MLFVFKPVFIVLPESVEKEREIKSEQQGVALYYSLLHNMRFSVYKSNIVVVKCTFK